MKTVHAPNSVDSFVDGITAIAAANPFVAIVLAVGVASFFASVMMKG